MTQQDKTTKRLEITLLAGGGRNAFNLTPSPVTLSFIYGIQTELTPFELALGQLDKGESITVELLGSELQPYFGSLYHEILKLTNMHLVPATVFLQFTLQKYSEVSAKEVVQAMARAVGHGNCGGSCDCGCGD